MHLNGHLMVSYVRNVYTKTIIICLFFFKLLSVMSRMVFGGFLLITSAKEVMFLPVFVCLFVCESAR